MNIENYDYIVAGSGFCGAVIARKIADGLQKRLIPGKGKILVIEKRPVISGNMYDEIDSNGILVQRYGPHVFHTSDEEVWQFIKPYSPSWNYFNTGCSRVDINVGSDFEIKYDTFDSPFNFTAIDALYDNNHAKELKNKLSIFFPDREKVNLHELQNCPDRDIKIFSQDLFQYDVRPYTIKQWGLSPEEIDKNILERIPMWLSYKKDGTGDKYQVQPEGGYYKLFKNLLDHPLIHVKTNLNIMEFLSIDTDMCVTTWLGNKISSEKKVFFTGRLDELLGYRFGICGYRSLDFEYISHDIDFFQNEAIMIHPLAPKYTRITEYKKLPVQDIRGKTTIAIEYPKPVLDQNTEPYYPLLTNENQKRYTKYKNEITNIRNLYSLGRLADYKYYNMDQAIKRALDVFKQAFYQTREEA